MKKNILLVMLLFLYFYVYSKTYEDYLIEGNIHFQKNEYDIAIEKYKQALKINPKDAYANYNLGIAYYNKGKNFYKDAILSYEKALKIDPQMVDAYFNLGVVYFYLGDYIEAEKNFKKAKEIASNDKMINDAIKYVEAKKVEMISKKQDDIVEIKIRKEEKPKIQESKKQIKDTKISQVVPQITEINYEIVTCKDVIDKEPKDETKIFTSLDEKVVIWVNFKNIIGKKLFMVKWITPDGKIDNIYRHEFISFGRYRIWAERKIKGSKMGNIKGKWKVETLLDDKLIAISFFEIK